MESPKDELTYHEKYSSKELQRPIRRPHCLFASSLQLPFRSTLAHHQESHRYFPLRCYLKQQSNLNIRGRSQAQPTTITEPKDFESASLALALLESSDDNIIILFFSQPQP